MFSLATKPIIPGIALCILAGCEPEPYSAVYVSDSPVIAQTDNHIFHEEDLDAEIRAMPASLQYLAEDPEVRAKILHAMIRRSIISQQAIRLDMHVQPQIQHRIQQAKDQILIDHLQQWRLTWMPKLSEEAIEDYYRNHQNDFVMQEQRHVRHILFKNDKTALNVLKKLQKGEQSFEELAAEYSEDINSKELGGSLNWFSRGTMVQAFEDASFELQNIGDIAEPFKTRFGWHIVELIGKRPESSKPLDEVRDEIFAILQQDSLNQWMDMLVERADIDILKPEYQIHDTNNEL